MRKLFILKCKNLSELNVKKIKLIGEANIEINLSQPTQSGLLIKAIAHNSCHGSALSMLQVKLLIVITSSHYIPNVKATFKLRNCPINHT